MIEMIIMEVISIISFLYSLLLFIFKFDSIEKTVILFGWNILVVVLTYYLSKKKKVYNILYLALFVPLIFYNDKSTTTFISITSILTMLYTKSSLGTWTHYRYISNFKKSFIAYIPFIYMRFLLNQYEMDLTDIIPFMVVYMITAITLSRTFRHLDSNMDLTNIRKNNIKTLAAMPIIFLVSVSSSIRGFISIAANKLLEIVYYPIYFITNLLENLLSKVSKGDKIIEEVEFGNAGPMEAMDADPVIDFQEILKKVEDTDLSFISTIFSIILIVIFIYVIYNMILKSNKSFHREIDYVEEREYIKKEKTSKIIFKRDPMPKDLTGQVRYYYRRFLEKLKKQDIEILNTDSTLDINQKAKAVINKDLSRIREVYIKTRYSTEEPTKESVDEIRDIYKKL